jgi:hypothetical protein
VEANDLSGMTPESQGITLGQNPCLDRCWEDFNRCVQNSTSGGLECLARLEACKRACAEQQPQQPEEPPPVQDQPCDQGPCPQCASELQLSNACNQRLGHPPPHTCSNGHSW